MAKNNGAFRIIKMVSMIVLTVLALAGLVWGAATSYHKLDTACTEQEKIRTKVELHEKSITTLEAKLELMHDDIKEINAKLP